MKKVNLHHWLFFIIVMALIFIVLIKSSDNAVADTTPIPAAGTVCCSFDHNGVTKTCLAPDGQTCAICKQVCDAQP